MTNMEKMSNTAKRLLTFPGISVGTDFLTGAEIGTTMGTVVGLTNEALHVGNGLANPLFSGTGLTLSTVMSPIAAGATVNSILKTSDWMTNHKKIRYLMNILAGGLTFAGGTAAAPYIIAGSAAYALGKPIYGFSKGALNRVAGSVWGVTGGAVKGATKGVINGLKGKQFEGVGIGKMNPKIN